MHDDRLQRRSAWIVLAAVLLVATGIRARLLDVPLERDEGEYAYIGQLMLDGTPPFEGAYNLKLPGTAAAYAASMAVFGESTLGVRAGLLLANLATIVLVFLLALRLMGSAAALAAAPAYGFLSVSPALLGPFGHATHFVALFGAAGLLALLRALASQRPLPRLLGAGFLLGLAILMKQPGGVFAVLAAGWLAWDRLRRRGTTLAGLAVEEAALCGGAALPILALAAWMAAAGTFGRFWFWVVEYGLAYSDVMPARAAPRLLGEAISRIVPPDWALWTLAAGGLAAVAWKGALVPNRGFLLALLVFSFVGVCPGFYFRRHYFILALPAVALLVGAAAHALAARVPAVAARWIVAGTVALACAQSAWANRGVLLELTPAQVSRALYGQNPFPESVEIARYLAAHTRAEERIAVLGSEPQIFFHAKRRSATGYIYVYSLMEPQPFAARMQDEMIAEVEAAHPAYVVMIGVSKSWLARPQSDRRLFAWSERFLAARYDVVGRIGILAPDRTEYAWDDRAASSSWSDVVVYRRKANVP